MSFDPLSRSDERPFINKYHYFLVSLYDSLDISHHLPQFLLPLVVHLFFFLAEDGIRDDLVTGVQTCALPIFVMFIVREMYTADPVLHLHVFKERTYSSGVVLMTTLGFVLYGSLVLLPLFLQTVLGYPAIEAGIAMAPRGMGSFIAMPVVGFLTAKFDARKLLSVGLVGGAMTLYALGSLNLQAGYWNIFWPQFFQGLSMGLIFVPLTTVTMSRIPKQELGNATSIFNLMRNLGGSVGIASIATMLNRSTL